MNCEGSAILIRKDILGPGTSFKHENIFPGRDHLVRIRQLDWNCTVINLHHQSGGTLQELRQRLRAAAARWPTYPDGIGFFVRSGWGTFNPCSQSSAMVTKGTLLTLLAAFSRSVEIAQSHSRGRTKGAMVPFTRFPAMTASLSTCQWSSCATSSTIPVLLGLSVTILCPVTTDLSG